MNKSATGLLLGSALVMSLSGCASTNHSPNGAEAPHWYQNKVVCGVAGALIGGGLGYGVSSGGSDEGTGAAVGAVGGATAAALLCKSPGTGIADSDGDGVPDYLDQCPGTPAGVAVDAKGCPLDSDGDGVPDFQDQCPDTPAGVKVNALGCPANLVLHNIHFKFNSYDLTADSQQTLSVVAQRLVANPNVRVRVEGHTDATGSAAYNLKLSKERANSVMRYLVGRGVNQDRITAEGFGMTRPVASNKTKAGRAENRRVEIAPVDGK